MYKFAYSTNAFTRYPLAAALKKINAIGFTGVEIVFDRPHFHPVITTAPNGAGSNHGLTIHPLYQIIKKQLRQNKLAVSNINANTCRMLDYRLQIPDCRFQISGSRKPAIYHLKSTIYKREPSLISPDESARNRRIEYTKRAIDLASFLGTRNISLTSGRPWPNISGHRALHFFQQSIKKIIDYAASKKIRLGIEYEPGHLIDNAEKTLGLIKKINHPLLGVNLDLGHSVVAGEKPDEVIKKFPGRIWNIHIEDIKNKKHFHLIPGKGTIDFEQIKKALAEVNYRGWLTVELYTYPHQPIRAGRLALKYLQKSYRDNTKKNYLTIQWQRLVYDKQTCPRCASTEKELKKALLTLKKYLSPMGISAVLKRSVLSAAKFKKKPLQSNRIWLNNRPLEDWLEGKAGQSRCCDICGPSECRTLAVGGKIYEAIPADLIIKAGLMAATQLASRCCGNKA